MREHREFGFFNRDKIHRWKNVVHKTLEAKNLGTAMREHMKFGFFNRDKIRKPEKAVPRFFSKENRVFCMKKKHEKKAVPV